MPEGVSLNALSDIVDGKDTLSVNNLPVGIRPSKDIEPGMVCQIIMHPTGDDNYVVVRHLLFKDRLPLNIAKGYGSGDVYIVPYRRNTWGAKKALQKLLQNLHGWQLLFASAGPKGGGPKATKEWTPSPEELQAGTAFINTEAPLSNGQSEQLLTPHALPWA